MHTIFLNLSIIPPSLAAVIKEHQESLQQFHDQLTSFDIQLSTVSTMSMEVTPSHNDQGTASIAGMKRKRV